jgi:hypothetical protein
LFLVMGGIVVPMRMVVAMAVSVVMMAASAQQPDTGDIDGQAESRNRDCLGKANGNGCKQPADRLVADQQRDHGQHDGAGEPSKVAQLSGAEGEPAIVRVFAGVGVSEGSQQ